MKIYKTTLSFSKRFSLTLVAAFCVATLRPALADAQERQDGNRSEQPSLDGSGNNRARPQQGAASTVYPRLGTARYADMVGSPINGPNARYISNRVFADKAQNLFSENGVTQWAWTWGQFIDHTIGLRVAGDEALPTTFDPDDPLEHFANDSAILHATRSAAAPGSGVLSPREQLNSISSYLDAFAVYGGNEARSEWLREGPVDGDPSNNGARLLLTPQGYLPRASERGDPATAPFMERPGQLRGAADADERVVIAGDQRANENMALTAVQTLFAREHNRLVDNLPTDWSEQRRFDAARLLLIALQQYITYEHFLPAVGVDLSPARGYQPSVDASISNEFATVGYRAHSMIHGELEMAAPADRFDAAELALFQAQGLEIARDETHVEIAIPLNVAFGNPQLVTAIGLAPVLQGLAGEAQYRNDEQIDNQLRSVLFQLIDDDVEDPDACLDGPALNECFALVHDLGTLDIIRARDHGMPSYAQLRALHDLPAITSFAELTGEASADFPLDDPLVDAGAPLDDPDILDFVSLRGRDGEDIAIGTEAADGEAVEGTRRTTLAARLQGLYHQVDQIEPFVGMVSEPHQEGSELGELQQAMWQRQFEALRDGDRFHYRWSRPLRALERELGQENRLPAELDYRRTLAEVIIANTELADRDLQPDVFFVAD